MAMGGADSSGVDSYDAVTEYSEDTTVDEESYSSTGTDENAILVSSGAKAVLKNITVDRTSSDSTGGDNMVLVQQFLQRTVHLISAMQTLQPMQQAAQGYLHTEMEPYMQQIRTSRRNRIRRVEFTLQEVEHCMHGI